MYIQARGVHPASYGAEDYHIGLEAGQEVGECLVVDLVYRGDGKFGGALLPAKLYSRGCGSTRVVGHAVDGEEDAIYKGREDIVAGEEGFKGGEDNAHFRIRNVVREGDWGRVG